MLYPVKNFILMQGLPGSGKSMFAQRLAQDCGYQLLQPDCIRYALGIKHNGEGWTPEKEDQVTEVIALQKAGLMHVGLPMVLDETHTKMGKVLANIKLAQKFGYSVQIYRMETPIDICKQRRAEMDFPLDVIDRTAENLKDFDRQWPALQQQYPSLTLKRFPYKQ